MVCHINVTPGSAAPSNAPQLQQMSPAVARVCLENNTLVTHLPRTFSDSLVLCFDLVDVNEASAKENVLVISDFL